MKIRVTFKDPDATWNASKELDMDVERIDIYAYKWVKYGEYITVEIETETNTIRVLEVGE